MSGMFPSMSKISYDDLSCGLGVNDADMAIRWCQEHGLISYVKECDTWRGYGVEKMGGHGNVNYHANEGLQYRRGHF